MSAYQPMIQEIQKKWATDKAKQNEEVQKFYEENNLKMTAGCAPMIANMLVLFGVIAVIQAPLKYIIRMPIEQVNNGAAIIQTYKGETDIAKNAAAMESRLIGEIRENPTLFIDGKEVYFTQDKKDEKVVILGDGQYFENGKIFDENGEIAVENVSARKVTMDQEWVKAVEEFKFDFMGMNLSRSPQLKFNLYALLPLLSILTMFGSQIIIMKTSGQMQMQGQNTMLFTTVFMGLFFGWYAFTVPVAFSLYYTVSNLLMLGQQLIVRRFHDPSKVKEEILQEIEERKKLKKAKKQVNVKDDKGNVVTKEMSENELAKMRLLKAREKALEKYGDLEEDLKKAKEIMEQAKEQNKLTQKSENISAEKTFVEKEMEEENKK